MLGDEISVLKQGPCVWALDDDLHILNLLTRIFEEGGYRFRGFESGVQLREAIRNVHAESDQPQLLLLDLMLPDVPGLVLLREIKSHPTFENLPCIVLTADGSQSTMLNVFEAGASDMLRKPFGIMELNVRVKWHLDAYRHVQQLAQSKRDQRLIAQLSALARDVHVRQDVCEFPAILNQSLDIQKCVLLTVDSDSGQFSTDSETPMVAFDFRQLSQITDALMRGHTYRVAGQNIQKACAFASLMVDLTETHHVKFVPVRFGEKLLGTYVFFFINTQSFGAQQLDDVIFPIANITALALNQTQQRSTAGLKAPGINTAVLSIEEYLLQVIEASPNAIVAARRDGQIVIFNQTASEILGWDQAQALTMNVRALYPPSSPAEEIMRRLRDPGLHGIGRLKRSRQFLRDQYGEDIPVNLSASIIYKEGQEVGSVGVFTDLRHRLKLEQELEQAEASLEASKQQVVMAELAGATAHELNQPLTSLLAYAELISSEIIRADAVKLDRALSTITTEAQRVADIVNKLANITAYRTRGYIGQHRIIDFNDQDEPEEEQ